MQRFLQIIAATTLFVVAACTRQVHAQSDPPTVTVVGQTAGATPFIARVRIAATGGGGLKSVKFEVVPKPGSVTRPISAVYFEDYLEASDYISYLTGEITVPVFGLYAGYSNTVKLTCRFADDSSLQENVTIVTPAFDDPYGYTAPTVLQARSNSTALSYDYFSVKAAEGPQSPVLIDTDGAVRWVGTSGISYFSSVFLDNSFFVPTDPNGGTNLTGLVRMELDGNYRLLADYADLGVTSDDHHNYDPGKDGFLVEVNTTAQTESVIMEVDTAGDVLRTWKLADIISAAMTAGGDDPGQFVYAAPTDWFHNNAAAYRKSDDSLIVSSRENFVIALDYETGAIKWILGDPTKHWYEFPSLRRYALAVAPGSVPPIGQHAISITHDDDLLLFDNGTNSMFQTPPGDSRTYSSPRKYQLDLQAMVATEVWDYPDDQSIYCKFTSSVYEDDPLNYFIDFANITIDGVPTYAEFLGLTPAGEKVFDYRYPATVIGAFAWNAVPIHLENLVYTGPQTALAAGHPAFFTGETLLTNGVYYLEFPGNGNVFGYYSYLADPHYIYHFDLGYEYWFDAADSQHGVYLYDFKSNGFFYTSPTFPFPYLYDFSLNTVLYYYPDPNNLGHYNTDGIRYFYDFATSQIITK